MTPRLFLKRDVTSPGTSGDRTVQVVRAILTDLFGLPAERSFAVRLWDGSIEGPATGQVPRFTLVLRRPGALRRMLLPPSELALGEAYLRDDFDVEGDLEAATSLGETLTERLRSPRALARLVSRLLALPGDELPTGERADGRPQLHLRGRQHTRERDAAAVRFHYDLGNDFYVLWLDQRLVYSCAYFQTGEEDLGAAQTAKLEHICRKLRLKAGERLLDIGCGWAGLVQYAAERYGVQATGITLSEPQARLARERVAMAGLSARCKIEVCDYRDLPAGSTFDKVVSVGMFEHVGRPQLFPYFAQAYRLTKPGGLFLNHGIVTLASKPAITPLEWPIRLLWRDGSFTQRHVFPDGELVTPGEVLGHAEMAGFETRDLESLREHYALTLRHWVQRLEARHEEAAALVGERIYRVWRLYMAASARAFVTARIGVVQVLLSKPGATGVCPLPLTRADLYHEAPDPATSAPGGGVRP